MVLTGNLLCLNVSLELQNVANKTGNDYGIYLSNDGRAFFCHQV